jgi:serine/threonine-protein kinase
MRLYAVKRLHPHLVTDDSAREMFREEARIGGFLAHPNIVGVIDFGEDVHGPFLVMDFVEGLSLASLMEITRTRGEALPGEVALRLGAGMARGLDAVHHATDSSGEPLGLVHRDLSPRNVLLGYDGSIRITDFGIARATGRALRTTTGVVKGTVGYLAPERLRFEECGPQSDLFSLGVVLYELLAGERLYSGGSVEAARSILSGSAPDIGEVRPETPPAIADLLFRLLARDPGDRPASASEVAHELESVLAEEVEPVDLGGFVSLLAAEHREAQQARIDAALAALPHRDALVEVETEIVPRRRQASAWLIAFGALALSGLGTFGLAHTLASPSGRPASETSSEVGAAPYDPRVTPGSRTDEIASDGPSRGGQNVAVAASPTSVEPSTDEPSTHEPSTDEPSTDEPSTDEPSTGTSVANAATTPMRVRARARRSREAARTLPRRRGDRAVMRAPAADTGPRVREGDSPHEMTWTGEFQ